MTNFIPTLALYSLRVNMRDDYDPEPGGLGSFWAVSRIRTVGYTRSRGGVYMERIRRVSGVSPVWIRG